MPGKAQTEIYDFGFWIYEEEESRGMRGEIAGDIQPAVKSCRSGTVKLWGTVKLHPPRLGGCSGGERITTWRWYKENGNYACGGGRDLLAWVG